VLPERQATARILAKKEKKKKEKKKGGESDLPVKALAMTSRPVREKGKVAA